MTAHVTVAEPGRLYTSDETAGLLGVHKRTMADWRKQNRGPAPVKDGGWLRYLGADINAYVKARRETAA